MGNTASRWTSADIPSQASKVAIVTGANSGIGYEAAKALAEHGATVILACRSEARGNEAVDQIKTSLKQDTTDTTTTSDTNNDNVKVEFMSLDLGDQASIKRFVKEFDAKYKRLDLLINNAGIMTPPERTETTDKFEGQFGINHLGHFSLTNLLLPTIVKTKDSRIVVLSSLAHTFVKEPMDLTDMNWTTRKYDKTMSYGYSKLSNMLFVNELDRLLVDTSTKVMAVHPGWTQTNLQQHSKFLMVVNPLFAMQPWQGALPTLYAACSPDAVSSKYYGPNGMGGVSGYPALAEQSPLGQDEEMAKKLWKLSEDMVGIKFPDGLPKK
jgi:NAD(P)-dependent dehydrogenase (short-subunit alcohol dehydrogenase family)